MKNRCNCCESKSSSGALSVLFVFALCLGGAWYLFGDQAKSSRETRGLAMVDLAHVDALEGLEGVIDTFLASVPAKDREFASIVDQSFSSSSKRDRDRVEEPQIIRMNIPSAMPQNEEWRGFASMGEGTARWN